MTVIATSSYSLDNYTLLAIDDIDSVPLEECIKR